MKYQKYYDVFASLGTIRERNGKLSGAASNIYRRAVLFLDFDRKDFPEMETAQAVCNHIRTVTDVYITAVINSGNGFHVYLGIEPNSDYKAVAETNKKLAAMVGADMNATLPTQIVRIPTSFNHKYNGAFDYDKQENWKRVITVFNSVTKKSYHRIHIDSIERQLEIDAKNGNVADEISERKKIWEMSNFNWADTKCFYCVKEIRKTGTIQGRRNFWLGRIVNLHKINGDSYAYSKNDVLEWNKLCCPPKNENELLTDFENYWATDYRLLGCVNTLSNPNDIAALEEVCVPALCLTNRNTNLAVTTKNNGMRMSNYLLSKQRLQRMSGYHLFLMTLIDYYDVECNYGYITIRFLRDKLTNEFRLGNQRWTRKCMSDQHCDNCLNDLERWGYITITAPRKKPNAQRQYHRIRIVKRLREFADGYIALYNSAALALQLNGISYSDYKVYICLIYHLQNGMSCTLSELANYLQVSSAVISESISRLAKLRMLKISKTINAIGTAKYNYYSLNEPDEIRGVMLNTKTDNGRYDCYEIKENADILNDKYVIELIP